MSQFALRPVEVGDLDAIFEQEPALGLQRRHGRPHGGDRRTRREVLEIRAGEREGDGDGECVCELGCDGERDGDGDGDCGDGECCRARVCACAGASSGDRCAPESDTAARAGVCSWCMCGCGSGCDSATRGVVPAAARYLAPESDIEPDADAEPVYEPARVGKGVAPDAGECASSARLLENGVVLAAAAADDEDDGPGIGEAPRSLSPFVGECLLLLSRSTRVDDDDDGVAAGDVPGLALPWWA